jgi:hypothetical protein
LFLPVKSCGSPQSVWEPPTALSCILYALPNRAAKERSVLKSGFWAACQVSAAFRSQMQLLPCLWLLLKCNLWTWSICYA